MLLSAKQTMRCIPVIIDNKNSSQYQRNMNMKEGPCENIMGVTSLRRITLKSNSHFLGIIFSVKESLGLPCCQKECSWEKQMDSKEGHQSVCVLRFLAPAGILAAMKVGWGLFSSKRVITGEISEWEKPQQFSPTASWPTQCPSGFHSQQLCSPLWG